MTSAIRNDLAPAAQPFVHLKVHSAYSLLEGALPIPKLGKLAAGKAIPAVALTDTIVPDFPLTNKSFNQSYAGNDL